MRTNHNVIQLICILFNIIAVIATSLVVFTSLGRQYGFQEAIPKLLRRDLQEVATDTPTPISPASWIHCFWGVVLIWQVTWSLHGLISICRKTAGVPVYTSPDLLSSIFLLVFDFACGCNVAWFILYDREYTTTSCLFIALTTFLVWTAHAISLYNLGANIFRLEKSERKREIWLTRIFVQNGIALYGMWAVFVMAHNFTLALIHNTQTHVEQDTATVVGLSIIGFVQLMYLSIDVICLDYYSRYIVTPYFIAIISLSASLFRQDSWSSSDVNFLFLVSLLAFAFVSIMVKSAIMAVRIMRAASGGGEITYTGTGRLSPADEAHYLLK